MLDGKVLLYSMWVLCVHMHSLGQIRSVPRSEFKIKCLLYVCKFTSSLRLFCGCIFFRPLETSDCFWDLRQTARRYFKVLTSSAALKSRRRSRKGSTPTTEKAKRAIDDKLKMLFPQQKHSQRESGQWESNPTHLLCRWLNDVPECSLATLWPPCGVLLEVAHPQFHFLDPPQHTHTHICISWLRHAEEIWWWKCVWLW